MSTGLVGLVGIDGGRLGNRPHGVRHMMGANDPSRDRLYGHIVVRKDRTAFLIAECGRTEQRNRSLPARTMAYFAIGMALHSEGSYEDVLALMTDGLAWAEPEAEAPKRPGKSAIS